MHEPVLDSSSQSLKFLDCGRPTALRERSPEQIPRSASRHKADSVTRFVLGQPCELRAGGRHTPALLLWDTHKVLASPAVETPLWNGDNSLPENQAQ